MGREGIEIISVGEPLNALQKDFTRAFNRAQEGAKQGLGLGLYIANTISVKHGFCLTYTHVDGQNHFMIRF